MLLESVHRTRNHGIPAFAAIRAQRFKWIEYRNGTRELYDLERDPHELENLHGRGHEEIEAELSARLRGLLGCAGALCRPAEDEAFESF